MAHLVLVLGGTRSGKSRWAERLAAQVPPVTYLATAQAGDAEMADRIARHRARRPADWQTVEEPWDLARAVTEHGNRGTLLIDCLTLWLTNRLVGVPGHVEETDEAIDRAVSELVDTMARVSGRLVVVSNETGCGIMPVNALARRFGDLAGSANQQMAEAAAEVHWCVAGIPQRIK